MDGGMPLAPGDLGMIAKMIKLTKELGLPGMALLKQLGGVGADNLGETTLQKNLPFMIEQTRVTPRRLPPSEPMNLRGTRTNNRQPAQKVAPPFGERFIPRDPAVLRRLEEQKKFDKGQATLRRSRKAPKEE